VISEWPRGYTHFPSVERRSGEFRIRPLEWEDREPIRRWRNEQIDVLRQTDQLSAEDQDAYYRAVLAPQFAEREPRQILWALEEDGTLVGYGGFVHIVWSDWRAEVSFLTETTRLDTRFESDWSVFLGMLVSVARDELELHKLTTETYSSRPQLIPILESHGFVLEGTLREHHRIDEHFVDSLVHGLLLN